MKILIVSDTHGNNESLENLVKEYPNMDYYLHAGDSNLNQYELGSFIACKGNCDYFCDFVNIVELKTPFGKLRMQHHPISNIASLKKDDIKIFIHGHTHIKEHKEIDGIHIICPGSLILPRDGDFGSYCILEISENKVSVSFNKQK